MISFDGRSRDNFGEMAVKNNPDFEEGVDVVGVSPLEDSISRGKR